MWRTDTAIASRSGGLSRASCLHYPVYADGASVEVIEHLDLDACSRQTGAPGYAAVSATMTLPRRIEPFAFVRLQVGKVAFLALVR